MPETAFIVTLTSDPLPGIIAAVSTAVAGLGGNVGVHAEGRDAQVAAERRPGERARRGQTLDVVQADARERALAHAGNPTWI